MTNNLVHRDEWERRVLKAALELNVLLRVAALIGVEVCVDMVVAPPPTRSPQITVQFPHP